MNARCTLPRKRDLRRCTVSHILTMFLHNGIMRNRLSIALIASLSACVGPPADHRVPAKSPATTQRMTRPPSLSTAQCEAALYRTRAQFTPLVDQQFSGSCSAIGAIQLNQISSGVPITNTKALTCNAALPLTRWFEGSVQTAAQRWFGARVVKLESMGTYACRTVVGNAYSAGKLSEHARANAVDIGGFTLADGRRVTVLGGWNGSEDERGFLRDVHDAACRNFVTVLGPNYNAAHANHLHFDMGGASYCR